MSLLAPLFLIGAAAIALPILFHLIRRTIREKQVFSSLMFLQPTPPRVTRQNRLENLLLLLARCAVIALLALAFARPFLANPVATGSPETQTRRLYILLDASASMQREDLWQQSLSRAQSALAQAGPDDLVAVAYFDRDLHPLLTLEQSMSLPALERLPRARQAVSMLKPGWGEARLGRAIVAATESFDQAARTGKDQQPRNRLHVISDFAEGSRLDGLQGYEWAKGMEIILDPVKASKPTNAGLQLLPASAGEEETNALSFRYRVTNSQDATREQFTLSWMSADQTTNSSWPAYVPPSQSRSFSSPVITARSAQLRLQGDEAGFDNTLYWTAPVAETVKIFHLGPGTLQDPNQPGFYLDKAFHSTPLRKFDVQAGAPGEFAAKSDSTGAKLIFCTASLNPPEAAALRRWTEAGGLLVVAPPDATSSEGLAALLGVPLVQIKEAPSRNYTLLAGVDLQHPWMAPFADSRFSDFTKIHFWKHRVLAPESLPSNSSILARFDDGSPAWIQAPAGKGSIFLMTSGWKPSDSQLALSSKFIPLLYSLVDQVHRNTELRGFVSVGDSVALPQGSNQVLTVRNPSGTETKLNRGAEFTGTQLPGIYRVLETGLEFAVNLPADETRTAPLPMERFEQLGLPLPKQASGVEQKLEEEEKRVLAAVELENRQKLWQWIIAAGLLFLIMETWLAGRLSRPASTA